MKKYQFSKIKNVHYNFFSAERGFSSFPYNSLNCSFNTQDSYENIIENRKYVKDIINLNDLFFINQICDIILKNKGANLLIDYGKNDPYGETLQSVFKNEKSNLFDKIGESDYSSLVDFRNIKQIVENKNYSITNLKHKENFYWKWV